MDLSHDAGRIDAYFGEKASKRSPGSNKRSPRSNNEILLGRVSVKQQHMLWLRAQAARRLREHAMPSSGSAKGAERAKYAQPRGKVGGSGKAPCSPQAGTGLHVDAPLLFKLQDIIGNVGTEYLSTLLRDGNGSIEEAVAVHFIANAGQSPALARSTVHATVHATGRGSGSDRETDGAGPDFQAAGAGNSNGLSLMAQSTSEGTKGTGKWMAQSTSEVWTKGTGEWTTHAAKDGMTLVAVGCSLALSTSWETGHEALKHTHTHAHAHA